MDDKQAKRLRFLLIVTWFLMLTILVLGLLVYASGSRPGPAGAKGLQGLPGKDAVVDYEELDPIIQSKVDSAVEALPKPKDGPPGTNGKDGRTPVEGVDYVDGKDGANGLNGASPQIQCNPDSKSLEWKLDTDDFWTILYVPCEAP